MVGDIADRKTADHAISAGVDRFGRIDTPVNNTGVFIAKPFTQHTEADYTAIVDVNIERFFHITQNVSCCAGNHVHSSATTGDIVN